MALPTLWEARADLSLPVVCWISSLARDREQMRYNDPTYVQAEIQANPVWTLAFRMSEFDNDNAPLGWGDYRPLAQWLINNFDMTERLPSPPSQEPGK